MKTDQESTRYREFTEEDYNKPVKEGDQVNDLGVWVPAAAGVMPVDHLRYRRPVETDENAEKQELQQPGVCLWMDKDDRYKTSCGIEIRDPEGHDQEAPNYCANCGGEVKVGQSLTPETKSSRSDPDREEPEMDKVEAALHILDNREGEHECIRDCARILRERIEKLEKENDSLQHCVREAGALLEQRKRMIKRGTVAAMAMQGFCAHPSVGMKDRETIAKLAVGHADALIKALEE